MNKFIVVLLVLFIFAACSQASKNRNKVDSTKVQQTKQNVDSIDAFSPSYLNTMVDSGSLEDIDKKTALLEAEVDSLYSSQLRLLATTKRQDLVYGLKKELKAELSGYKYDFINRAEIVYMSYGVGAKEERLAASKGYYYLLLREKKMLLLSIGENISDW